MRLSLTLIAIATSAFGLDNTKMLPKGVRGLTVTTGYSQTNQNSGPGGQHSDLGAGLSRSISFRDFAGPNPPDSMLALLSSQNISLDDPVGYLGAEASAKSKALVAQLSWGLSDRFNVGLVIPYFHMATRTQMSFTPSRQSQQMVRSLELAGKHEQARDAAFKLTNALTQLDRDLLAAGYQPVGYWEGSGIGDVTIGAKYLGYQSQHLRVATVAGVQAPTGATEDPDILTDTSFGDGHWDVYAGVKLDQPIGWGIFFNQSATYTYAVPSKRTMRTGPGPLPETKRDLRVKHGDKLASEASVQIHHGTGLLAGSGYTYERKSRDRYPRDYESLGEHTDQSLHRTESLLGYSSLPAYRSKQTGLPFRATLT